MAISAKWSFRHNSPARLVDLDLWRTWCMCAGVPLPITSSFIACRRYHHKRMSETGINGRSSVASEELKAPVGQGLRLAANTISVLPEIKSTPHEDTAKAFRLEKKRQFPAKPLVGGVSCLFHLPSK
jgi:hypothetical protein